MGSTPGMPSPAAGQMAPQPIEPVGPRRYSAGAAVAIVLLALLLGGAAAAAVLRFV
jgi:hypothetical protein